MQINKARCVAFFLCVWNMGECASYWIPERGCIGPVLGDAALGTGLDFAPCAAVSIYNMECGGSMFGSV